MPRQRRRSEYRNLSKYEHSALIPPEGVGWLWLTADLIESPAWFGLSLAARRILDRLMSEHIRQGGQENGRLAVSYDALEACGVDRKRIRGVLDDLDARGLLKLSQQGRRPRGEDPGRVATYRLTFVGVIGDHAQAGPPTNEWKGFKPAEKTKKDVPTRPKLCLVRAA